MEPLQQTETRMLLWKTIAIDSRVLGQPNFAEGRTSPVGRPCPMPLSVNTVELPMVCAVPRTFREAILSKSHVHGGAPGAETALTYGKDYVSEDLEFFEAYFCEDFASNRQISNAFVVAVLSVSFVFLQSDENRIFHALSYTPTSTSNTSTTGWTNEQQEDPPGTLGFCSNFAFFRRFMIFCWLCGLL